MSTPGAGTTYTYDPNGNLTQKVEGSDTWAYEWNAHNQLTRVTKNSVEQARFSYDPLGRRVEKVAGGLTTSYAYDRGAVLREVSGSTSLKFVHGPNVDEPFAIDDGTMFSYFHADGLGSIVKMTDAAATVTLTRRYDAWGNIEAGSSQPGYAYTGREWDPEVGLYYYRARYYDPRVGRFISEDPIGHEGGDNLYSYVANSPIGYADAEGLCPHVIPIKAEETFRGPNRATGGRQYQIHDVMYANLTGQSGCCPDKRCTYAVFKTWRSRWRPYAPDTRTYGAWNEWEGYYGSRKGTLTIAWNCDTQTYTIISYHVTGY